MHVYQSTIGYVIWSTQEPSVCPNSLANYRRREILLYWFDISNRTGAKSSQPYQMGRWCHWFYGWSILTYRMHPIQWVKPQTTTGIITIQWSITSFASLLPLRLYIARINFPGSWHEAQVNQSLIRQVVHNIGDYKICVDQGFPRSGDLLNKFVGPISRRSRENIEPHNGSAIIRRHNTYVSLHQACEWGSRPC